MENYFSKSSKDVEKELNTNLNNGLKSEDVLERQEEYGFNELKEGKKKSIFIKFLEQFKDFMIIVLIIAAIISGIIGVLEGEGLTDTIIIMVVIIANAIIGVAQEQKAEKSLEALQKLSANTAKVIRDGKQLIVPARELVKGDIVVLDTGDYVPADLRIFESINLKTQESALTGESVPVEKITEKIEEKEVGIADRVNMAFSSSLVTYGRGKGIVVETAMNTEVGKIAQFISNAKKEETPLAKKLNRLGKVLGIVALAICIVIFVIGLVYGKEPLDMFMTAVSLAVAAIPEGLAAVSTIVLAIGVQRMVKKHAIVKKLPAVETLGSTTVICSDKTGTLTQNKMTVKKIFWNNKTVNLEDIKDVDDELRGLIYTSMLCNDTKVGADKKLIGDPTETALVDMGFNLSFDPSKFGEYKRVEEIPFDSERKLMTTVNKVGDRFFVYTKGGIDELLARCSKVELFGEIIEKENEYEERIKQENENMAKSALRVLGMAYKEIDHKPSKEEMESLESNLIFLGMCGMIDPPRMEVKDAVSKCKTAGIRTVMITRNFRK